MSNVLLCVKDRKVWKAHTFWSPEARCPTCGARGKDMGFRWRPPRLTNTSAWERIERGDYLWERDRTFDDKCGPDRKVLKPPGFGRYIPLEIRKKFRAL